MKVAFRADASHQIGTGHVMRCLALADRLRAEGAECLFICREHQGHLLGGIDERGHASHALPMDEDAGAAEDGEDGAGPVHASWLGAGWRQDCAQTRAVIEAFAPDWLVVDHYALDARWERALRPHCGRLMAIDDIADRPHDCDVLLDQTYGRDGRDYAALVPDGCRLLVGSQHALLRPEFAALRPYSLKCRRKRGIERLLIAMGGFDKDNVTGLILEALSGSAIAEDWHVTVVLASGAPWLADVEARARSLSCQVEMRTNVSDMAELMAESDLAFGASGSTAWERCCLGLPALMVVIADNQRLIAENLHRAGAALLIGQLATLTAEHVAGALLCIQTRGRLAAMSRAAAAICDGLGTERVRELMVNG